jgi:hypothetical protein
MIHSGEGAKVDLWTQVPLTQVIETLKYWGCRGGVKDFGRAFGRGVRRSSKWNRGRNWRQGSGYRKGHVRGFRFVREGCPCAHENVFEVKGGIKRMGLDVTDLQGPPSERTPEQKLWDFKTRAQQYARDRESCDDVRISYLEFLETEAEDDLALARMIAG